MKYKHKYHAVILEMKYKNKHHAVILEMTYKHKYQADILSTNININIMQLFSR